MALFFISLITFVILDPLKCNGAHIAFVHPCVSHSHMVVSSPIINALHSLGHKITVISTQLPLNPPKNRSNYDVIIPRKAREACTSLQNSNLGLETRLSPILSRIPAYAIWPFLSIKMCEAFYSSGELLTWIQSDPKVDLIFLDAVVEFPFALRHKLGAKMILLSLVSPTLQIMEATGMPLEMVPYMEMGSNQFPLSYAQRVTAVVGALLNKLALRITSPKMDETVRKYLGDGIPPIEELTRNDVSLVFKNSHQLEDFGRVAPPNVISIPGIHVKETHSPLDKEIEDFIGKQRFIYISLGTAVDVGLLTESIKDAFFTSIRNHPEIQFLWKWSAEAPKDTPKNLYLAKWFNQQDVLGHKSILGFVTQGGRPSSQEAMFNSVPMIVFPVLGDQDYNAAVLETIGVAIKLEIITVTSKQLTGAISGLSSEKLRKRAAEVSRILKDVRSTPLETAVWWTEYLLRQNDTSHLRSPLQTQTWAQRKLIDVWAALFVLILLITLLTFKIAQIVISKILNLFKNTNKIIAAEINWNKNK